MPSLAIVTQPTLVQPPQWGSEEDIPASGQKELAFALVDVPCLWSIECTEVGSVSAGVTFGVETNVPRGTLPELVEFSVATLDDPRLQVDSLRGIMRLVVWGTSVRIFARGTPSGRARVKLSPGSVAFGAAAGGGGSLSPSRNADTAVRSDVAQNAASVTLISALNGPLSHRGCNIHNDAAANLRIRFASDGGAASATDFSLIIPPQTLWEMEFPFYIGRINGIWDAAGGGAARITQFGEM